MCDVVHSICVRIPAAPDEKPGKIRTLFRECRNMASASVGLDKILTRDEIASAWGAPAEAPSRVAFEYGDVPGE